MIVVDRSITCDPSDSLSACIDVVVGASGVEVLVPGLGPGIGIVAGCGAFPGHDSSSQTVVGIGPLHSILFARLQEIARHVPGIGPVDCATTGGNVLGEEVSVWIVGVGEAWTVCRGGRL